MAFKPHSEKVENFAFHPVRAGPDRFERIGDRIRAADAGAQADPGLTRDRQQLIVQFEARLVGVAVDAGGVAQLIEIELGIFLALFRDGPQKLVRHDQRGFAAMFNDLGDSFGVPRTKTLDDSSSACIGEFRHVNEIPEGQLALLPRLIPVECALLQQIDVTNQQDGDIDHHLYEAEPPRCNVTYQILENEGPGVKEDSFNIEQDEDHGNEVEFHGERLARVSGGRDSTLVRLLLRLAGTFPSHQGRKRDECSGKKCRHQQVYY